MLEQFKNDFAILTKTSLDYITYPLRWKLLNWIIVFMVVLTIAGSFYIDEIVRSYFFLNHNLYFDFFANIGHFYGKIYLSILVPVLLYAAGLIFQKRKLNILAFKILTAFILSGLISTILKSLFGRWRPYTFHGSFDFVFFTLGPNDHLSFPSGDIVVAFAFSSVLAGIYGNVFWKIFCYFFAFLTFFGRIYHDQHWLSDAVLSPIISLSVTYVMNKNFKNTNNE